MIKNLCLLCLILAVATGCAPRQSELGSPVPTTPIPVTPTPSTAATGLALIQERGVLIIGTAITEPFEYHDSQTSELVGFDVEVARYIANRLGVTLKWVELPFASLIPALQENKVDMVIAAMYITPERELAVDFADPYIDTGLVMAIRPDLAGKILQTTDLDNLKVGVKIGATGEKLATQLLADGIPLQIRNYRTTLDSFLDLEVGRIDIVFNDYLNTLHYIKKNRSSIQVAVDSQGQVIFLSEASLGIAVQQGNDSLREAINAALIEMHNDGTLTHLFQTYISSDISP